MTDTDSRIARLEERAKGMDEWREACAMLPVTVAELVQYRKDQNGYMREMRDDVKTMMSVYPQIKALIEDNNTLMAAYHEKQGVNKWFKAAASILSVTGIVAIITLVSTWLQ